MTRTVVGGTLVRPHDLELFDEPAEGSVEAMIVRVTVLGRDVKVELHGVDGAEIVAVLTTTALRRARALARPDRLGPRPRSERVFAGA